MAVSTFFFFSFFSKKTVKNDVFVRIENKTDYDFKEIRLGRRIIKKDSYKSTSYESKFGGVEKNGVSDYVNTTGKHIGYSRMRLSIDPKGYLTVPPPHIQQQLQGENSFSDPWENPYSGELIDGFSLNKGYYTFVITERNGKGFIDIRKDK